MVNIIGNLNKNRFTNKGYIIAKTGLTSNWPSIFPNKDRDAGKLIRNMVCTILLIQYLFNRIRWYISLFLDSNLHRLESKIP